MRYRFFTLQQAEDALRRAANNNAMQFDTVFQPLRLERMVLEDAGGNMSDKRLSDIFHLLYASEHRLTDLKRRSPQADIRASVLKALKKQPGYTELRHFCEENAAVAFETAKMLLSFVAEIEKHLQDSAGKLPSVLSRLHAKQYELSSELHDSLGNVQQNSAATAEILRSGEKLASVTEQIGVVHEMLMDNLQKKMLGEIPALQSALQASLETARMTAYTAICWGGDEHDSASKMKNHSELQKKLQENDYLRDITRQLGRMKEVLSSLRKNAYVHGHGEKFSLTRGRDLRNLLSGELALLASPATTPLFLRRYNAKGLNQYAKREKVRKGGGDVIVCLDESGSTRGDNAAWGKALALAVQDICDHEGRKFTLVHFAGKKHIRVDRFLPGNFTRSDVLASAEHFFGGNTDFEVPLTEALRLIREEGFEKADILFVTDGYCDIGDAMAEQLQAAISSAQCSVIGLLMDQDSPGNPCSIEQFCEKVFRLSELNPESVEKQIIERFFV